MPKRNQGKACFFEKKEQKTFGILMRAEGAF
jgi:hypothetical protein